MGWTKSQDGVITGDAPSDALGSSLDYVIAAYQGELGRLPTRKEWEALLADALRAQFGGSPRLTMEMSFDASKLREALSGLSAEHVQAFAAGCAQR